MPVIAVTAHDIGRVAGLTVTGDAVHRAAERAFDAELDPAYAQVLEWAPLALPEEEDAAEATASTMILRDAIARVAWARYLASGGVYVTEGGGIALSTGYDESRVGMMGDQARARMAAALTERTRADLVRAGLAIAPARLAPAPRPVRTIL